jgi:hypothetical protein
VSEPQLQYDDATHTYTVGGVVYPSVTQVLGEAGLIDDTWYTEEGAERGSRVALVTELYDTGELDEATYTEKFPNEAGYLAAWRAFRCEHVERIEGIEEVVCSHIYKYAGRLDRRVVLHTGAAVILDIKTGAHQWWWQYQTAAYAACFLPSILRARMAVQLKPNGKYTCHIHDNYAHDIDVFRAALCIANEKREHGKTGDRYA